MSNGWKAGNEFLPYHPDASHVDPQYRKGWNDCYEAAPHRPVATTVYQWMVEGSTGVTPPALADVLEVLRKRFESLNSDSYGFKRSRKGYYVNPTVSRDWKWFQLGAGFSTKDGRTK